MAYGPLVVDMTTSLDGFVTAPSSAAGVDRDVLDETRTSFGAYLMGRRLFEEAPGLTSGAPCFVLTRRARDSLVRGRTTYAFVDSGIGHALELARAAAGDRAIAILGGASVAQQYLRAGFVDELRLHLVPVLLGSGTRLFDDLGGAPIRLRRTGGIDSPHTTHLKFRVAREM